MSLSIIPAYQQSPAVPSPVTAPIARRDRKQVERSSSALAVELAETRNSTVHSLARVEGQTLVGLATGRGQQQLAADLTRGAGAVFAVAQDVVAANPASADFVAQRLTAAGAQLDEAYRETSRELARRGLEGMRQV